MAVPKAPGDPALSGTTAKLSRLAKLLEDNVEPQMPDVSCPHLLHLFLYRVGPFISSHEGPLPLSEEELRAFQANRGIELAPWVVDGFRRLSDEYIAQGEVSKSHECPPPWKPSVEEFRKEILPTRIKSLFRS